MRQMRTFVMSLGLSCVYWGVVTPLAWCLQVMGRKPLAMSPDPALSTYWLPTEIESTAKDLYREGSGLDVERQWGGGWLRLIREYRTMARGMLPSTKWIALLALLPWVPFACSREDPQVRSDLYVLF